MHGDTGPAWKPTPKFIMRAACIAELTVGWPPGPFVEMGAGTGTMTRLLLDRGFPGTCYDITPETRSILRRNLGEYGEQVTVAEDPSDIAAEAFDYLLAFEVLEHIEDDLGALKSWVGYLRPGGRLLVSVPAHQRKFGRGDEAVGHVRRYEQAELQQLLVRAGFTDIRIVNYGFPLGNVTRLVQKGIDAWTERKDVKELSPVERSVASGIVSSPASRRVGSIIDERTLAPFLALQRRFYGKDWGDGYVATARLAG